jgi:hypothetical protein
VLAFTLAGIFLTLAVVVSPWAFRQWLQRRRKAAAACMTALQALVEAYQVSTETQQQARTAVEQSVQNLANLPAIRR